MHCMLVSVSQVPCGWTDLKHTKAKAVTPPYCWHMQPRPCAYRGSLSPLRPTWLLLLQRSGKSASAPKYHLQRWSCSSKRQSSSVRIAAQHVDGSCMGTIGCTLLLLLLLCV